MMILETGAAPCPGAARGHSGARSIPVLGGLGHGTRAPLLMPKHG